MKKLIALSVSISLILSLSACKLEENIESSSNNISETSEIAESSQNQNKELSTITLKNSMSAKEKNSVSIRNITLNMDEIDIENEKSDVSDSEHIVEIKLWYKEELKNYYEELKRTGVFTEEEYKDSVKFINENPGVKMVHKILIDGRDYMGIYPPYNYDGNVSIGVSGDSGETEVESFDELKEWYKEECKRNVEDGIFTQEEADQNYSDMLIVWQSVIDNTYKELEAKPKTVSDWGFDKEYDDVVAISDYIKEISIYDEELDTTFIVHITLPPDFDENKTYPMLMMTDGVWRLGDHPALRKLMEEGKTEDVFLASIGYDFDIDGTDNAVRGKYFCEHKDLFLNFITDNLMPYISENYNIDFSRTGLYGHSLGGVFAHYAAFNSDLYENQPFNYYIIGSPAFWSPYSLPYGDYEYKSEYGYFDRNDTFNKTLYISGGENEDPDYEEYYEDNDTTLEGISNLMSRLDLNGVTTAECKIYKGSNHYEYIPDMFKEILLKFYDKSE